MSEYMPNVQIELYKYNVYASGFNENYYGKNQLIVYCEKSKNNDSKDLPNSKDLSVYNTNEKNFDLLKDAIKIDLKNQDNLVDFLKKYGPFFYDRENIDGIFRDSDWFWEDSRVFGDNRFTGALFYENSAAIIRNIYFLKQVILLNSSLSLEPARIVKQLLKLIAAKREAYVLNETDNSTSAEYIPRESYYLKDFIDHFPFLKDMFKKTYFNKREIDFRKDELRMSSDIENMFRAIDKEDYSFINSISEKIIGRIINKELENVEPNFSYNDGKPSYIWKAPSILPVLYYEFVQSLIGNNYWVECGSKTCKTIFLKSNGSNKMYCSPRCLNNAYGQRKRLKDPEGVKETKKRSNEKSKAKKYNINHKIIDINQ